MRNRIIAAARLPLALVLLIVGWALWLIDDLVRLVRRSVRR